MSFSCQLGLGDLHGRRTWWEREPSSCGVSGGLESLRFTPSSHQLRTGFFPGGSSNFSIGLSTLDHESILSLSLNSSNTLASSMVFPRGSSKFSIGSILKSSNSKGTLPSTMSRRRCVPSRSGWATHLAGELQRKAVVGNARPTNYRLV